MFVPYASEIWTKSIGPNYKKLWAFWQEKKKTKQNKTKRVLKNIFDKALTPFWKTFLQVKHLFDAKLLISTPPSFSVPQITVVQTINFHTTVFQCSTNYGSSTRVTRLKVAPNMAIPISLNEMRQYP